MKQAFQILSAPEMFGFMKGQPGRLLQLGYSTTVLSGESDALDQAAFNEGAARIRMPISRDIDMCSDAATLLHICWHIFARRPQAVILSGPKAIFLGSIAAWIFDVPCRIAVYHGMRQETFSGPKHVLLNVCDRISFSCATDVLAVSRSLQSLMISKRLVSPEKVSVCGPGSANGVDCEFYALSGDVLMAEELQRERLGIPMDAVTIGYVGRLTEDKGINELYACFLALKKKHAQLKLIVVGPDEMSTHQGRLLLDRMRENMDVFVVGGVADVRPFYAMMRVHVFPSHREGFGMAVVEAAAMGVPTTAFDVTGVRDSVADGVSGKLVPIHDVAALASATDAYLTDEVLRRKDGAAAAQRARRLYNPDRVWEGYSRCLSALG